jgi:hypothetical protein
VEPNELVIARRRALLGDAKADLSAAEDPMVLAFARGWITEADLRAGKAFAACYRATHPTRRTAPGYEAPDSGDRDLRSIREMGDVEIVEAFDKLMDATLGEATSEARQQVANARYARLSAALAPLEHGEVFAAFVREAWPQWLTWRIAGRDQTADSSRRHAALMRGLAVLADILRTGPKRDIGEIIGAQSRDGRDPNPKIPTTAG